MRAWTLAEYKALGLPLDPYVENAWREAPARSYMTEWTLDAATRMHRDFVNAGCPGVKLWLDDLGYGEVETGTFALRCKDVVPSAYISFGSQYPEDREPCFCLGDGELYPTSVDTAVKDLLAFIHH